MAKLRKMLGAADSTYILSLMKAIETQSNETIANWCIEYAEKSILYIYEKYYPEDNRLQNALNGARECVSVKIKVPELKKLVSEVRNAAKEADKKPAAQAAARTVAQAAGSFYTPTHSLGLVFYGAAAIAYDRVGLDEKAEVYEIIAAEECAKMEAALRAISVKNEPNPAKISWYC
jgi:hypothetical protein